MYSDRNKIRMTEFSPKKMVEKLVTYFMQLDLQRFALNLMCWTLGSTKIVDFNILK